VHQMSWQKKRKTTCKDIFIPPTNEENKATIKSNEGVTSTLDEVALATKEAAIAVTQEPHNNPAGNSNTYNTMVADGNVSAEQRASQVLLQLKRCNGRIYSVVATACFFMG
jgi:hypothetical protein